MEIIQREPRPIIEIRNSHRTTQQQSPCPFPRAKKGILQEQEDEKDENEKRMCGLVSSDLQSA